MSKVSKWGFTMIEVMLVMAIIGSLLAAIMMTIRMPINRSQYTDVVTSFQDYLKDQYIELDNISFDKIEDKDQAIIQQIGGSGGSCIGAQENDSKKYYGAGRSPCFVIGKMIYLDTLNDEQGTSIRSYKVFYRDDGSDDGNDFENFFSDEVNENNQGNNEFKKSITIGDKERDSHKLNWISDLKTPKGKLIHRKILIIKSPIDGTIRTYVSPNSKTSYDKKQDKKTSEVIKMITESNQKESVDFCIHPMNNPYGPIKAVRINKYNTNPSGVEIMPTNVDKVRMDGNHSEVVKCK